jgi:hypothetical protein
MFGLDSMKLLEESEEESGEDSEKEIDYVEAMTRDEDVGGVLTPLDLEIPTVGDKRLELCKHDQQVVQ